MKKLSFLLLTGAILTMSACSEDSTDTEETSGTTDTEAGITPVSAFEEFNSDAVTVSFEGDEITIESTALPKHTTPYWGSGHSLYIEPVVANESQMSPGKISEGSC